MRIVEYASGLRTADASVAIALLELLRKCDERCELDRATWLTSLQVSLRRHGAVTQSPSGEAIGTDELGPYVEEHILSRLIEDGIVEVTPDRQAWENVRLAQAIQAEVDGNRAVAIDGLEHAVRNLLDTATRLAGPEAISGAIAGGSTLAAMSLVKAYRRRKVVNEVDVNVSQGEIVGLLGPNGAGKTTTFYMMVGLIKPDEGRVELDGEDLTRVAMFQRARKGIGYLAQEPSIFRKLTVEQNILAILETLPLSRSERKQRLEELLDELGIKHLRKSKAYSLSGGERRRLEITRALVSRPKFMLLDEPFAGVDPIAVHDIQQIVAELRHRGIGVIITDHNVEQTLDIVDRAYIMYDGRVRVSGTVAELVWNEEVAEIYFGPTLTARMRERYARPEAIT